jgi:hypothetical protein
MAHNGDAIRDREDIIQVMRDDLDTGAASGDVANQLERPLRLRDAQGDGGLIDDDQPPAPGRGTRNCHCLPLAPDILRTGMLKGTAAARVLSCSRVPSLKALRPTTLSGTKRTRTGSRPRNRVSAAVKSRHSARSW